MKTSRTKEDRGQFACLLQGSSLVIRTRTMIIRNFIKLSIGDFRVLHIKYSL